MSASPVCTSLDLLPQSQPPTYELFSLEPTGSELGHGKDATAYATAPGLVYRKSHENPFLSHPAHAPHFADHVQREVAAYADLPDFVQAARTIIGWVKDDRIHKIIEHGEGQPIFSVYASGEIVERARYRDDWEAAIARMAAVPQAHFQKLVDDEAELRKRAIYMDYLGPANLLYEAAKGFTIIDAEFEPSIPLKGKCMYSALISVNALMLLIGQGPSWQGKISEAARDSTVTVLRKLELAGHKPAQKLLYQLVCERLEYFPG